MAQPTIDQLEAELRESRTQAWDVEEFLARRHQAKIDALTAPRRGRVHWQVVKELGYLALAAVGYLTLCTIAFLWLLTGQFPLP